MGKKDPATLRQKRFILALGGKWDPKMTVEEASNLIDQLLKKREVSTLQEITELCQKYAEINQRLQQANEKKFAELLIEQVEITKRISKALRSLYTTSAYNAGVEIIKKFVGEDLASRLRR
jgi:hypothetical protein